MSASFFAVLETVKWVFLVIFKHCDKMKLLFRGPILVSYDLICSLEWMRHKSSSGHPTATTFMIVIERKNSHKLKDKRVCPPQGIFGWSGAPFSPADAVVDGQSNGFVTTRALFRSKYFIGEAMLMLSDHSSFNSLNFWLKARISFGFRPHQTSSGKIIEKFSVLLSRLEYFLYHKKKELLEKKFDQCRK